jgi:hypothetical protein
METIHKANYKDKVEVYMGYGTYLETPTTYCRGGKGFYSSRPPRGKLSRNWKDVNCKNCINKRNKVEK